MTTIAINNKKRAGINNNQQGFYFDRQVHVMGFLDLMRIYIFSEVDGIVLYEGLPVIGAKVIRSADYKNKIHSQTTVTDSHGHFHFNDLYEYSLRLSETAILQKIVIEYKGRVYLAWRLMKRNEQRFGELNDPGTPESDLVKLNLSCELTADQEKAQTTGSELRKRTIYGLCTWNSVTLPNRGQVLNTESK